MKERVVYRREQLEDFVRESGRFLTENKAYLVDSGGQGRCLEGPQRTKDYLKEKSQSQFQVYNSIGNHKEE